MESLFAETDAAEGSAEGAPAPDVDPATAAWLVQVARLRARRAGRNQLVLMVVAVLVVDLVLAVVIPRLLPFLVLSRSSAVAQTASAPAGPKPAAALPGSPADTVLTQVAGDAALLPAGWVRVSSTSAAYGSPYARACPTAFPPGTAGVAARFVSGRLVAAAGSPRDVGLGLSLTALPPGQGARAVDRLRTWVATCPGSDGLDPAIVDGPAVAPLPGAAAFVAKGGSAPIVTWVVWARGDLLIRASVTGLTSTAGAWPKVVAAVDAVVQHYLRPVCPDLAPTADDALRNPALPGYRPWAPLRTIAAPPVDVVPDPPAAPLPSVTLPDPVPHPDLAPVVIPDRSTWADTNGDGLGDTPPPVSAAPRGTVPVFRDPESIVVPDRLVTTAPVEPARPAVPAASLAVPLPAVDATGPGCGWAFSGAAAPRFDEAAVASAAQRAEASALTTAAAAAATYSAQEKIWQPAERTYLIDLASFTTWSRYDAALSEARQQLAYARSAYDASLAAYQAAVAAALPVTPPSPSTPSTPSTPPTGSPTTTPTPGGTTSPSPTNPGG